MASTNFPASHPLAVKVWARKAFADAVKATTYGKLTGKSDRAIVQVKDELKKEGDRIRFRIRMLPTGIGVQDNETLEGKEEGLDYKHFDLNLGEKRHAFQVDLNLSENRTMANVREDMKAAQQEWLEEYLDTTFFEVLSGAGTGPGGVSKYHPSGMLGGNPLLAPSADRIVYGGTGVAAKAALQATDIMTLTVLDKLAERAKLASPTMRKGLFDGKQAWVAILHPWQVTSLRTNTSTGQWLDIQKAAMMGGKVSDNPIWGAALGMYHDIILVESTRIQTFSDYGAGGNVRAARGLLLGAQAGVVAHGVGADDKGRTKVVEKEKDYGKYLGSGMTMIWGMSKVRFEGQSDFGVFAFDTAAAPLT
ncbi:N4-gp56 family major capsid protein [Sphingomonas baiyangensis]|uniref:N4-gp56 family major capsid protein n=1 Tax=Sphingomonas baiyangensis TaxID=2572576 RepID=A0A4U1L265_9SPHN|nr:N4-gp56 family major capsid protein [Sphingomonas baiyangensis]TKD50574.1 N4-gp56 family major capsid protein [Sphingomonas baiyangensis]